ncbi:MAG: transglutaminase-like domain-containing protein [Saprospiraceae bacterium]
MKLLLSTIFILFLCCFMYAQKGVDTTQLDLKSFANTLAGNETNNYKKAENVLHWLSNHFDWLYTDYEKRTVKEIMVRGGGNCFELSVVFIALIKELGITYRPIAEINLHIETPRRQVDAARMVKEKGNRMSVFGFNHNDHRWIEVYNDDTKEWVPADPTMGLIGLECWLKARAWYGPRKTINQEFSDDMIVPIGIFVVGDKGKMIENRTSFYVVESLDNLYQNKLSRSVYWHAWKSGISSISEKCRQAFMGEINLHESQNEIKNLGEIYRKMKIENQ